MRWHGLDRLAGDSDPLLVNPLFILSLADFERQSLAHGLEVRALPQIRKFPALLGFYGLNQAIQAP